jgi:hypothetical protein
MEKLQKNIVELNGLLIDKKNINKKIKDTKEAILSEYLEGLSLALKEDMKMPDGTVFSNKAKAIVYRTRLIDNDSEATKALQLFDKVVEKGVNIDKLKSMKWSDLVILSKLNKARCKKINYNNLVESIKELYKIQSERETLKGAKEVIKAYKEARAK